MGQPEQESSYRGVSVRQCQGCAMFVDDSLLIRRSKNVEEPEHIDVSGVRPCEEDKTDLSFDKAVWGIAIEETVWGLKAPIVLPIVVRGLESHFEGH